MSEQQPFGYTWECPTCYEVTVCDAVGKRRYQCGNCGDVIPAEDIRNDEFCYEDEPEPPRRADQSLDDPALATFFEDLAQMDAERAEAEERGIPDYDDMGFLRGYTPPTDPRDL